MLFDMCSIWNMCLQRWADHSFWTLSHSGAAPEASGSFSVVFICEEDRQRERFSGPGSHARALCKCQPALASAHLKDVFHRFSVSAFCGYLEPKRLQCASKIRLAAQSGTLRSVTCSSRGNTNTVLGPCGAGTGSAADR